MWKKILVLVAVFAVGFAIFIPWGMKKAETATQELYGKPLEKGEKLADVMAYDVHVSSTVKLMREKLALLEYVDLMQSKVWYNAIHEKYDSDTDAFTTTEEVYALPYLGVRKGYKFLDFSTALSNLYRDETFSKRHTEAKATINVLQDRIAKLHDYPKSYEKTHDAVVDLYAAYVVYADIVLDPEGSYTTYTANALSAKQELQKQFSIVETYTTTTEE